MPKDDLVAAYFENDQWNILDEKDIVSEIADGLWYGGMELGEEDTWAVGTVDDDGKFHVVVQATFVNDADSDCLKFARELVKRARACA